MAATSDSRTLCIDTGNQQEEPFRQMQSFLPFSRCMLSRFTYIRRRERLQEGRTDIRSALDIRHLRLDQNLTFQNRHLTSAMRRARSRAKLCPRLGRRNVWHDLSIRVCGTNLRPLLHLVHGAGLGCRERRRGPLVRNLMIRLVMADENCVPSLT